MMILSSSNTKINICVYCVCAFCVFLTSCNSNTAIHTTSNINGEAKIQQSQNFNSADYVLLTLEGGIELIFYTHDGEVLYRNIYSKYPTINKLTEGLYIIIASTGVNSNYSLFIDVNSKKVSDMHFNLLCYDQNKIAVLESGEIIIKDMFTPQIVYKKIKRPFSKVAVPQMAILKANLMKNTLYVEYLSGDEYEKVCEEIIF